MTHGISPWKGASWPAVLVGCATLSGCFFDQVQHSEERDIQRVQQKQAILQAEQSNSSTLKQQEDTLTAELSEREFSLQELTERVEKINEQNGRVLADNESMRFQYGELLHRLHETNEELAATRQGSTDSIELRRERITSLKSRLKAEVDLLFP